MKSQIPDESKKINVFAIAIAISIVISSSPVHSQFNLSEFKDTTDNAFDISSWMDNLFGFVPVATVITEPALGIGVAGALVFVNRKYDTEGKLRLQPPDVYGLGGMYTSNGSWGMGGGYMGFWKEDRIRYRGGIGYGAFNLDFYQASRNGEERKFAFNIEGFSLLQEINFRIAKAPLFAGIQYSFATSSVKFQDDPLNEVPGVDPLVLENRSGGLGPVLTYDSRDNSFTPSSGVRARAMWQYYDELFGSEPQFHKIHTFFVGYLRMNSSLIGGIRFRYASSGAPFYSLPYIEEEYQVSGIKATTP